MLIAELRVQKSVAGVLFVVCPRNAFSKNAHLFPYIN
jgi:hypothetical protein